MKGRKKHDEGLLRELQRLRRRVSELEASLEKTRAADTVPFTGGEYMRYLLDHSFDLIVVVDREGKIIYLTPSIESQLGYTREEVLGANAFDYIHPEDVQRISEFYNKGLGYGGYSRKVEFRIKHRDGSWRYMEAVGNNLLDNPEVQGIVVNTRDITDRVQVEKELREAEERYRTIIDSANDAVFIHDVKDGELLFTNRKVTEMYGYTFEELHGLGLAAFETHQEPYTLKNLVALGSKAAKGEPQLFEWRPRDKKGNPFWVEVNIKRSFIAGRHCIISVVRDISERKRAQEELVKSEEYFRSLIEHTSDIIAVLDADGTVRYVSPSISRISGDKPEDVIGKSSFENIHPDDISSLIKVFSEGLKTRGITASAEYRIRHKDGSWHTYHGVGQNLLDNPYIRGIVVHSTDITEQKRLEEELQRSEEYFRSLIENASDILVVVNADGAIRYIGPSVKRVTGYEPEELVGRNIFDFAHPDDMKRSARDLARAAATRGITQYAEVRIRHKDGSWHYYEASSNNLLENPAVLGVVINARDITERKEAERFNRIQRDLAVSLSGASTLKEALRISLEGILEATGMDGGIIYLVDRETGGLDLAHHAGFSESFVGRVSHYHPGDPAVRAIMSGEPIYAEYPTAEAVPASAGEEEGLKAVAVVPIRHEGAVIGCLNLASRTLPEVPAGTRQMIEILAGQVGQSISHARLVSALRESEERYRHIFDYSGDAIFIYDRELKITGVNRQACQLIGYSEEELVGKNIFELSILHPDDYRKGFRNNQRIFAGEVVNAELRFITKDGGVLVGDVTGAPLYDREGEVIAVTNVARDVTERKRHQERLHKLNQCFLGLGPDPLENIKSITLAGKDILEGFAVQYCRLDKGRFSYFLASREDGDFVRPESPEGYICFDCILSNLDQPLIIEDLGGAPANNDPLVKEKEYESFLGYPTRLSGKTVGALCLYGKGEGGFAQEDINFLGMLARALTIEEERLAHEESIRHFVDIASHELRTPLSIIKGYADAFEQGDLMELNRFQMDKIRIINAKADKMTKTINDLMHLSRIERGQFMIEKQEVDLENLIQGVLKQMREKGLRNNFTLSIPEGMECCEADPEKLGDALRILLDNAANYSPPASDIEVRAVAGDGGVVISVLDRGWGIEEKDRARIFERFYQGEDSRHHSASGMGLGLFIAREIVVGHGGRIWYEPREGGGSIFSLSIPT